MNFLLLLLAIVGFQVATSSEVQHRDVLQFENNFEPRVNPLTIEEKDVVIIDGKRYYFSLLDVTGNTI
ncbi:hypothetical protein B566_EDAN015170 [Ephemera danica]|nr:hypothetical protein B566_EDAN015170 [Ephemera danica]